MRQTDPGSVEIPVHRFIGGAGTPATDHVAVEEPLDIRIAHGPRDGRTGETVAVTMRTPGDDVSLALGFLVAEGIVRAPADVERAYPCGANAAGPRHGQNAVRVELAPHLAVDLSRLRRHTLTSSACGVCGKTSIAALETAGVIVRMPASWRMGRPARPKVTATVGGAAPGELGLDSLLDFRVEMTVDGETLSAAEVRKLLDETNGLAFIRGRWVEVDRERLGRTLDRFETIERRAAAEGLSFGEATRLAAGAAIAEGEAVGRADADWSETVAGP